MFGRRDIFSFSSLVLELVFLLRKQRANSRSQRIIPVTLPARVILSGAARGTVRDHLMASRKGKDLTVSTTCSSSVKSANI